MVVGVRNAAVAFVGLMTLACDPPYYSSPAFFANTTRSPVKVRLSRLDAALACSAVSGRSGEVLSHAAFAPEATYRVEAGQALPLGPIEDEMEQPIDPCGAVMLQILGHDDLAVYWSGGNVSSEKLASLEDRNFREHAVRLEGTTGLERLAIGDELEGSEPLFEPGRVESPRLFGWSGQAFGVPTVIGRRDVLPDGCLAIGDASGSAGKTLYLCVPDWAFPFEVGETIVATAASVGPRAADAGAGSPAARKLVVQASTATTTTRLLEIWLDANAEVLPALTTPHSEPGHFTSCGAYVEPIRVQPTVGGAPLRDALAPGELDDYTDGPARVRVLVGRTERVVVAPHDCEPERASLNDHFDLLMLRTIEGTTP